MCWFRSLSYTAEVIRERVTCVRRACRPTTQFSKPFSCNPELMPEAAAWTSEYKFRRDFLCVEPLDTLMLRIP